MANEWTAQVNTTTKYVGSVVRLAEPREPAPAGTQYVDVADDSVIGKYYVNGAFQTDPPG